MQHRFKGSEIFKEKYTYLLISWSDELKWFSKLKKKDLMIFFKLEKLQMFTFE